jgi:hypothetical protein
LLEATSAAQQREVKRALAGDREHSAVDRVAVANGLPHWSFPVKDPMGNTVEITTPQRNAWPPSN